MLPVVLQLLLSGLVTALVTEGLKALSTVIGRDLTGKATVVASIIVGVVIFTFETIVAALPKEWQNVVQQFIQLILAILTAGGMWRFAKLARPVL